MDPEPSYLYYLDIQYENDLQYRKCLRSLFCMISHESLDKDLDEVTMDENNYDEEKSKKAMDYVYSRTTNHPLFNHLYEKAAALMFSVDKSIGLCVLFSYDYLQCFHNCLKCFFQEPEQFNEKSHPYQDLVKAL
jgi:hypothetical protein